jgi:hypothetical protein
LDEDVKAVLVQWFKQQITEFSVEGSHWLMRRWDACLNAHGDYF